MSSTKPSVSNTKPSVSNTGSGSNADVTWTCSAPSEGELLEQPLMMPKAINGIASSFRFESKPQTDRRIEKLDTGIENIR